MKINRKQFYDGYRKAFAPSKDKPLNLTQPQVDGLNFLLDKLEADTFSLEQASYVLATVKHETANTFQPIREKRGKPGTKIRDTQDKYWGTGAYGRGYVQITWPTNYKKFGLSKPEYDKALEPETAYDILSRGMRDGMFTKYKLSDFINDDFIDYYNARQIVNGFDKANQIADIAEKFEEVIDAATVTDRVTEQRPDVKAPEETPASPQVVDQPGPQINIEHADQVKTDTLAQPIDGGRKDDPPMQASQGGTKSTIATIIGGITGIGTAIGGWLSSNGSLAMVGVICITLVLLSWMYRQLIMDYFRLKYMSDPTKINVK